VKCDIFVEKRLKAQGSRLKGDKELKIIEPFFFIQNPASGIQHQTAQNNRTIVLQTFRFKVKFRWLINKRDMPCPSMNSIAKIVT
jgi:hypothetical protein